jgi:cell division protein ZapE
MTPKERYQKAILSGQLMPDVEQAAVVDEFQQIYQIFVRAKRDWRKWFRSHQQPEGLYLWGGVGIGKTCLMDIFYESLPTTAKLRTHFHRFMRDVHKQLTQLQGERDPLKKVAKHLSKQAKIICFDEFFVSDITDAMLLGNLLAALFDEGVILLATSNLSPDQLYRNGLQRDRFLPAISLLKQHLKVVHLSVQCDYRLRKLEQAGTYFYPLNAESERQLKASFDYFAHDTAMAGGHLEIEGRNIRTVYRGNDVVWFDFRELCSVPRSQLDYLEIAREYPTVLLSGVPQIKSGEENAVCYLINLVDVFYDAQVKLILSAAVPAADIYPHGRLSFEFKRTVSRLLEMQSTDYLSKPHLGKKQS